jgi:hypothetical protein
LKEEQQQDNQQNAEQHGVSPFWIQKIPNDNEVKGVGNNGICVVVLQLAGELPNVQTDVDVLPDIQMVMHGSYYFLSGQLEVSISEG